MPSDISRRDDDLHHPYRGVVMQQGRVILDRDFNALRQIIDRRVDADALDFVGPSGTPDNGFAIGAPVSIASPPIFRRLLFSPPAGPIGDFSISAGTMYVGGQRALFPTGGFGQSVPSYSYSNQPDWLHPDPPATPLAQEAVFLHLFEQEVSAVEDPDLLDVALGGPDTTARLQLLQRVKRLPVTSTDCSAAQAQVQSALLAKGLAFDPVSMRLLPQAKLQVSFAATNAAADPCDPVAQGGYLGAENQLIRVQITDGGVAGATPQLVWGYDNASFLYRGTVSDATTMVLGRSPVDAFHMPRQGQVVEILRTAYIIDTEPDASNPQNPNVIRCVAEATGIIRTLTQPYQPDTRAIVLDQALPAEYASDTNPLFVRIWQSQVALVADGKTATELTDASVGATTGVLVTISVPAQANGQGVPPVGAYWTFAVRPSTPQGVYPERYLTSAQAPEGPRQWICPLATIDWSAPNTTSPPSSPPTSGPIIHDCREVFDNLVDLTKRKTGGGCCAVTLRPEDLLANPTALQHAVDQFANAAQGAAVCLMPGTYALTLPLRLDSSHSGISLEACHGAVIFQMAATADISQFVNGLVTISAAADVSFCGIRFVPPAVPLVAAIANRSDLNSLQTTAGQLSDPHMLIGLRLLDSTNVKVSNCEFLFSPASGVGNFGAGVFASGDCTGLNIKLSRFTGPARLRFRFPLNLLAADRALLERVSLSPQAGGASVPSTAPTTSGASTFTAAALANTATTTSAVPLTSAVLREATIAAPSAAATATAAAAPAARLAAPLAAGVLTTTATPVSATVIASGASPIATTVASPISTLNPVVLNPVAINPAATVGAAPVISPIAGAGATAVTAPITSPVSIPIGAATTTTVSPISVLANRLSLFTVAQNIALTPGIISAVDPALIATTPAPIAVIPPQVMLSALLMAPTIDANFVPSTTTTAPTPNEATLLAQAVLDKAEFSDNRMQGLTIGVLAAAVAGNVKIKDNTAMDCIGGIWFAGLNQDNVLDAGEFQTALQSVIQQGASAGSAMKLAMWYPLPQPSAITARVVLSTQLHVVNNRIDALPGNGAVSGPACFLYVLAPPAAAAGLAAVNITPADFNTAILFNSNHVRNLSAIGTSDAPLSGLFGATTLLVGAANIIANGNLIRNLQTASSDSRTTVNSLMIVPGVGGAMAVAGNILTGISNLVATRPELTPFSQSSLNAVPELAQLATWKFLNHAVP